MVKTYAHFCFDTLVSFKMGMVEEGSWWERRGESLQVKGKIVGGGGRQRKFEGEGGASRRLSQGGAC